MVSDEELNGGPASCPPELQTTTTEIDKNESFHSRSGKVIQVIKKKGSPTALPHYLQRTTFLPAETSAPFGTLPGFYTSQGTISPPCEPVGGFILEEGKWILHASPGSYH